MPDNEQVEQWLADHGDDAASFAEERFEFAKPDGVNNHEGLHRYLLVVHMRLPCRIRSSSEPSSAQMAQSSQLQEDVVEAGVLHLNRSDAFLEVDDHAGHELGAVGSLKPKRAVRFLDLHAVAGGHFFTQAGVARHDDDVAPAGAATAGVSTA